MVLLPIASPCAPFFLWDQYFFEKLRKTSWKLWNIGFWDRILNFYTFLGHFVRFFGCSSCCLSNVRSIFLLEKVLHIVSSSSFNICSMLAWWASAFSRQRVQIVLHNLVLGLAWYSSSCSTINHQTSAFANPFLSSHPFHVAKPPESHLPHDHRNILYS